MAGKNELYWRLPELEYSLCTCRQDKESDETLKCSGRSYRSSDALTATCLKMSGSWIKSVFGKDIEEHFQNDQNARKRQEEIFNLLFSHYRANGGILKDENGEILEGYLKIEKASEVAIYTDMRLQSKEKYPYYISWDRFYCCGKTWKRPQTMEEKALKCPVHYQTHGITPRGRKIEIYKCPSCGHNPMIL